MTKDAKTTYADMGTASADSMAMVGRLSNAMMEFIGKTGTEFVEFFNDRLKEDAKMQQKLMSCHSMEEFAALQSSFVKKAMDQYTAETGKMVKIGSEAMEEIFASAKS